LMEQASIWCFFSIAQVRTFSSNYSHSDWADFFKFL
jgi:hypothetical protein